MLLVAFLPARRPLGSENDLAPTRTPRDCLRNLLRQRHRGVADSLATIQIPPENKEGEGSATMDPGTDAPNYSGNSGGARTNERYRYASTVSLIASEPC